VNAASAKTFALTRSFASIGPFVFRTRPAIDITRSRAPNDKSRRACGRPSRARGPSGTSSNRSLCPAGRARQDARSPGTAGRSASACANRGVRARSLAAESVRSRPGSRPPTRRSELQLAEHEQDDQHDNNHPDDTDPAIAAHAASSELTGTCTPGLRSNLHRGNITSNPFVDKQRLPCKSHRRRHRPSL
jgi:hypothetical protein